MTTPSTISVQVYVKENCGLCEELLSELQAFLADFKLQDATPAISLQLEIRDIEDSAEWVARFSEYVPTVVVNDQEVCHYFFDPEEFTEALECPSHT